MTRNTSTLSSGGGFYGWITLAGASLVYFIASGTFYYSFGVFLPTMSEELGWGRGALGAGLSVSLLTYGLASPLVGASIAKFGPRINIVLGNLLAALGLVGMSLTQQVWHVYFFYGGLVGLGVSFGLYIPCTTLVNNWFIKKRSLGMGLVVAAGGLGGFAFPPLVTWLISTIGWQMSWIAMGGINFAFAVLIGGLVLIRNRPEDRGQVPDGISIELSKGKEMAALSSKAYVGQADWKVKQAIRSTTTWLITALCAANFFALGTLTAHQVAYLRDIGFTSMLAAMILGIISVASIVGRLGFGALALKFEVRYLAAASFIVQVGALSILLTTENLALIYLYAILIGSSYGALLVAFPTLIGKYYGRTHYAQILGFIFPLGLAIEAVGPFLAGAIYDATSTYMPAFALVAAFSLVGFVCAILARPPKLRQ